MKKISLIATSILVLTSWKIYESSARDENYSSRLADIAKKINSVNTTWKAESPERFRDLTKTEASNLCGTKLDKNFGLKDVSHYYNLESNGLPDSFDSRQKWPKCQSIKEIRDQSSCGSCWAFGASETMSDRWCIASGQTDQKRISAEDLNSCCFECGQGCNGGYAGAAWNHWLTEGLVSGGIYGDNRWCLPYSLAPCAHHTKSQKYKPCDQEYSTPACTQKCSKEYMGTYFKDKTFGKNAYSLSGARTMMAEIINRGPIDVAITVYEDFLTYKSGVYQHLTGMALGGHSVKIIGWGNESGVDYWIVVNSWNETWGDDGTIKMLRGSNESGIESFGFAGTADWKE